MVQRWHTCALVTPKGPGMVFTKGMQRWCYGVLCNSKLQTYNGT
jgi:hypothetical protein